MKAKITIKGSEACLSGSFPHAPVVDATSYYKQGYQFMPRFRQGHWDGRIKLFSQMKKTFPAGLTFAVKEALEEAGVQVEVDDLRSCPPLPPRHQEDTVLHGVSFDYPYDFQLDAMEALILGQRGIASIATNGGKSELACLIAACLRLPTLFLVPGKELLYQTQRRFATRFGISTDEIGIIGDGRWCPNQWITVSTVNSLFQRLGRKDQKAWDLLMSTQLLFIDECFPAGTLVGGRKIEEIRIGDFVPSFDEKIGKVVERRVSKVFISKPKSLVKVKLRDRVLVCTLGHPFLTQRGWVPASLLGESDVVLCGLSRGEVFHADGSVLALQKTSGEDKDQEKFSVLFDVSRCSSGGKKKSGLYGVQGVRNFGRGQRARGFVPGSERESLLQRSLQGEMGSEKAFGIHDKEQPFAIGRDLSPNARKESYVRPPGSEEAERDSSGHGLAASNPGGKRKRPHSSGEAVEGGFGVERDCSQNEEEKGLWVSLPLQSGCGEQRFDGGCRDRWGVSLLGREAGARSEERRSLAWIGVDSVEVLEPGSNGTFGGVCAEGLVYNLEVDGTHTYLANGAVVHNCHRASANSWYEVVSSCDAFFRFGLSGTPLKRTDGADLRLLASTGPVLYEMSNKELIRRGISSEVEVQFLPIRKPDIPKGTPYYDSYKAGITGNVFRNRAIAVLTHQFVQEGRSVVILVKEIPHGWELDKRLWTFKQRFFLTHQFINGEMDMAVRQQALRDFEKGDVMALIATSILDEGVDIPNIDVLIMAGGGKSSIKTLQRVGRGIRRGGVGKLIVVDFVDYTSQYLLEHSLQRYRDYKAEDCFVIREISLG